MARINIEDNFWLEITGVAAQMGSQDLAIGNAVRFFRYAQERAKAGKFLTEDEFKQKGFAESLFPDFAVRSPSGIQARGFEKHFGWLVKRVKAGRKGGKVKSEAKRNKLKQTVANGSNTEASPSPSPSPNESSSDSSLFTEREKIASRPDLNRMVWDAYSKSYQKRYGKPPVRNAKVNSQTAQLAARLGGDAPAVIEFYLTHNDGFYLKKVHSLGLCLQDAEALHTQWVRDRPVTASLVRQFEKQQSTQNLIDMIDRGEIK